MFGYVFKSDVYVQENLKEREKTFLTDARGQEIRNAWTRRPPLIAAAAPRYQVLKSNFSGEENLLFYFFSLIHVMFYIQIPSGRFEEDDEAWQEKRKQKEEEMEIIMQRAKERKEEEEKRFEEQRQAAQLKKKQLEASMFANVK